MRVEMVLCALLAGVALGKDNVFALTDANFNRMIWENVVFVKFHAPWCEHCRDLVPLFEELAVHVKTLGKPWVIAELDVAAHTQTRKSLGITQIPVIYLFVDGSPYVYDKDRTIDSFVNYIENKVNTKAKYLESKGNVQEVAENGERRKVILVGGSEMDLEMINILARKDFDFVFYYTTEYIGKRVFPELSIFPAVVLLKDYDDRQGIYDDSLNYEKLVAFLNRHRIPAMTQLDETAYRIIFARPEKKGVVYYHARLKEDRMALEEMFMQFAIANQQDDLLFVSVDITSKFGEPLAKHLGLKEKDVPVVEVLDMTKNSTLRYRLQKRITPKSMEEFLSQYNRGQIQKFMRSEEVPKDRSAPVYKLVGKNWLEDVIENELDVLVKFYAPWCGYCKKFAPVYESFARYVAQVAPNIRIAEIDMTLNDVEGMIINAFPTVMIFPAGGKLAPVEYDKKEFSIILLNEFLQDHALSLKKQDL